MNRGTENNLVVASDRRLRQWDVVAPGQSGFINPAGTKAPHYSDQFDLYLNFGKKRQWYTALEVNRHAESKVTLHY